MMITSTSIVYLIALPLAGAVILMLAGRRSDKWGHLLATALCASSFFVGLYQLSLMFNRPSQEDYYLISYLSVLFFSLLVLAH